MQLGHASHPYFLCCITEGLCGTGARRFCIVKDETHNHAAILLLRQCSNIVDDKTCFTCSDKEKTWKLYTVLGASWEVDANSSQISTQHPVLVLARSLLFHPEILRDRKRSRQWLSSLISSTANIRKVCGTVHDVECVSLTCLQRQHLIGNFCTEARRCNTRG
jgi:hypothetical protein